MNFNKIFFLLFILLSIASANAFSDFNYEYSTSLNITNDNATSKEFTFPIYLIDSWNHDFNGDGLVSVEDKAYAQSMGYVLINYNVLKQADGSDIIAVIDGTPLVQNLTEFNTSKIYETAGKIILQGVTTPSTSIPITVTYGETTDEYSTSSDTDGNYYYEISTSGITEGVDVTVSYLGTSLVGPVSSDDTGYYSVLWVETPSIPSGSTEELIVYFACEDPESYTVLSELPEILVESDAIPYWIEYVEGNYYVWIKTNGLETVTIENTEGYNPNGTAVFEFYDSFDEDMGYNTYNQVASRNIYRSNGKLYNADSTGGDDIVLYTKNNVLLTDNQAVDIQLVGVSGIYTTAWQEHSLIVQSVQGSSTVHAGLGYHHADGSSSYYYLYYLNGFPTTTGTYTENDKLSISRAGTTFTTYVNDVETLSQDSETLEALDYYVGVKCRDCWNSAESTSIWDNLKIRKYLETPPTVTRTDNTYEIGACALENYQIQLDGSDLGIESVDDSLYVYSYILGQGVDYSDFTLISAESYESSQYGFDVTVPTTALVDTAVSLEITPIGFTPTQITTYWGDGYASSGSSVSHAYAADGNYDIVISAYLDTDKIERYFPITILDQEPINITVNVYNEQTKEFLGEKTYVYTISGTYEVNQTATVTSIDGGTISGSYNNVVRSIIPTGTTANLYFPPENSSLAQIRLSSYYDDTITIKENTYTIYSGQKVVNTYLIVGKVYKIYINGIYWKDIVVEGSRDIIVDHVSSAVLGLTPIENEEYIILYGSSDSYSTDITINFTDLNHTTAYPYTLTQDLTVIQILKDDILENLINSTETDEYILVYMTIYDADTGELLLSSDFFIKPEYMDNSFTEKIFGLLAMFVCLFTLMLFPKRLFEFGLLACSGICAVTGYYLNSGAMGLFTTGFFVGLTVIAFIIRRMRDPQ